jgi:hypothetical protein
MLAGLLAFAADPNWRTFSLCVLLFWQGSLYVAAPLYSLLSLNREAALAAHVTEQGRPVMEQRAARWVVVFSMLLIAAFSLIRLLPSPAELPGYARFLPIDIAPQQLLGHEREAANPPTATVTVESANCRSRPRGGSDKVTILYKGQKVEIVGRNADLNNPWWYVKIPTLSGNCWLWSMTATMTGNVDEIPIIQ